MTHPTTGGRPDPNRGAEDPATLDDPLAADRLLRACRRVAWEGLQRPVLGRVVLLAPVGRGGMGAVYRGVHRTLGHDRAVKVLLASADDAARERFLREARFAAQIDSPHLVRVHDADEDSASGLVYLEMEFVRGVSAAQWAREAVLAGAGGVREADAVLVCVAACRGLEAAHAAGVVHRDLKPGNILLPAGPDGRPNLAGAKVADLGLARHEDCDASLTATNTFVGTPGFAAPEQISDAKSAGRAADVFSMGATLYALLGGRSPFDGTSTSDTIVRTTLGRRVPLAELRRGLSEGTLAIVERCLAMHPADRFADATALREALEARLLGGEAPTTAGAGWAISRSEEPTVSGAAPVRSSAPASQEPAAARAAPTDWDPAAGSARPEVASPPPAGSAAPAPAQEPPPVRGMAPWAVAGLAVAALVTVVLWRGGGDGTDPGGNGAAPAVPPVTTAAHLLFCPPGARVFVGDRQIRDGDPIPLGTGSARIELDGHETQTVPFAPNEKGEIWIRPANFRPVTGRLLVAKFQSDIRAYVGGRLVSGPLPAPPGDEVTVEFRLKGFHPQSLTEIVPADTTTILTPRELWFWSGLVPVELAAGTKLRFETVREPVREPADAAAPGGAECDVEWEAECIAADPAAPKLRVRLTRVRGRALTPRGEALAFDSADAGWTALLAEHEAEVAAAAPLELFRHGAIEVTFDAEGRPASWSPFPARAPGLAGVAAGSDEDVRRSVIGLLTLRPDLAEVAPLGSFSFTGSTETEAELWASRREGGTQLVSALKVSLADGLGTSLEIETRIPAGVPKISMRRK